MFNPPPWASLAMSGSPGGLREPPGPSLLTALAKTQTNCTWPHIKLISVLLNYSGCKPRNDPLDKLKREPGPDKEPPDRDICNDDLRDNHHYQKESQPGCYNHLMNMTCISMLLPRIILDAPATQNFQDNKSLEKPEEKEPQDWPPGILEDKNGVKRRVSGAVDRLWAGPGPPIKGEPTTG